MKVTIFSKKTSRLLLGVLAVNFLNATINSTVTHAEIKRAVGGG